MFRMQMSILSIQKQHKNLPFLPRCVVDPKGNKIPLIGDAATEKNKKIIHNLV